MGIDFLEIQFELERRLPIQRVRGEFADFDLTAGGLEEIIWRKVELENATARPEGTKPISREECWLVVQETLAEVLALESAEVRRDSHLIKDLGMQ
jgi:hypothetical protein